MEVSKLLSLARVKLDDPLFPDSDDEGSLFKTSELLEYINSALREVVFRGKLIIKNDVSLNLVANTREYTVPTGMLVIDKAYNEDNEPLSKVQEVDLEGNSYLYCFNSSNYKEDTADIPTHFFQQLTPNKLIVYPIPSRDSILLIRGSYIPTIDEELETADDLPSELNEIYQRDLIYWVLAEAFEKPDADTYDPKKSEKNRDKFIEIFGHKLPADQLAEIMAFPDDPGSMKDY